LRRNIFVFLHKNCSLFPEKERILVEEEFSGIHLEDIEIEVII